MAKTKVSLAQLEALKRLAKGETLEYFRGYGNFQPAFVAWGDNPFDQLHRATFHNLQNKGFIQEAGNNIWKISEAGRALVKSEEE